MIIMKSTFLPNGHDKILENEEMVSLTGSLEQHLLVVAGAPISSKAAGKLSS